MKYSYKCNIIQIPPHSWLLKVASATALGIVLTRVHCAFSSSSSITAVFHRPGYVIASLLVVVPCASISARQNQWEPSFSLRISLWFPQTKFDSRRPTYWSRTLEKSMRMKDDDWRYLFPTFDYPAMGYGLILIQVKSRTIRISRKSSRVGTPQLIQHLLFHSLFLMEQLKYASAKFN